MIDPNQLTKRYYKIGEVAELFDVATSLIRYWESEFPQLKPIKGKSGIRRYQKEDILLIDKIYYLVKEQGFKLKAAREHLDKKPNVIPSGNDHKNDKLFAVRQQLLELREGLLDLKSKIRH